MNENEYSAIKQAVHETFDKRIVVLFQRELDSRLRQMIHDEVKSQLSFVLQDMAKLVTSATSKK